MFRFHTICWLALAFGLIPAAVTADDRAARLFQEVYYMKDRDRGRSTHPSPHWRRIRVPGAVCGDGAPYSIFVRRGDPRKLLFHLMGGGACWSRSTCYGPTPLTYLHPLPYPFEPGGILSHEAFADHTAIYLPYCTADVFAGRHVAEYGGTHVHHAGARNMERVLGQLEGLTGVRPAQAENAVVYGYSAGAIGALYHSAAIDRILPSSAAKTLLADAPGLHWRDDFWDKFTPELFADFQAAGRAVGYPISRDSANLSGMVSHLCERLEGWSVGVLQGSRDWVMARLFGGMSPEAHERLVYSDEGVYSRTARAADLCRVWAPSTPMHTFLALDASSSIEAGGVTAMEFAIEVNGGLEGPNYR